MMKTKHTLKPIYNNTSRILILGSLPSVKSREQQFYYAHPKNRFWHVLEKVFKEEIGTEKEDKIKFLYKHHIALFDVIKECDIKSSSDASIKNVIPNNLSTILKESKIKAIFTTGTKAHRLYQKYLYPKTKIEDIPLPSTSPANCKISLEELTNHYQRIKKELENE